MTKNQEFEKYLQKIEDPNYQGEINYDLPEYATPLEVAKYNVCQAILAYRQDNNISTEELAQRIRLSIPKTKEIFFAQIEKFTLDHLIVYASRLFNPSEIKLT